MSTKFLRTNNKPGERGCQGAAVHLALNARSTHCAVKERETQALYGTVLGSIMHLAKHRFVQIEGNEVMADAGKTNYCQVSVRLVSAADRLPNYSYQCQFLAIFYNSYTVQKWSTECLCVKEEICSGPEKPHVLTFSTVLVEIMAWI